jgi:hypothetical protein
MRIHTTSAARKPGAYGRCGLRRDLGWLLAVKFAALGLLWLMFFSAAHRPAVDTSAARQRLAVAALAPRSTMSEPDIKTAE